MKVFQILPVADSRRTHALMKFGLTSILFVLLIILNVVLYIEICVIEKDIRNIAENESLRHE